MFRKELDRDGVCKIQTDRVNDMIALASDFDGTLYFVREQVQMKEGDIRSIQEFQSRGNLFGICTGRSLLGITQVVNDRVAFDFYILVSGALILDKNLQVLSRKCISGMLLKEVYEKYYGQVKIIIMANDTVYTLDKPHPLETYIRSLDDLEGGYIYGMSFGAENVGKAREISEEINRDYGDRLHAFANVSNVDIVSKECSKGNAVKFIKERMEIACLGGIGDSYNDIPLLDSSDHPFTFPYAPDGVKAHARDIVGSVEEAIHLLEAGMESF